MSPTVNTERDREERVPVPIWGPRSETEHGLIAVNRSGPSQLAHLLTGHLILCNFTPYAHKETSLGGSRVRNADANPGSCEVVPALADYWARWHEQKQIGVFVIEATWLEKLAVESFDQVKVELETNALPFTSERIRQLAYMLRSDLLRLHRAPMKLYTDSLLTLLGVELLQNHSSLNRKSPGRVEYIPRKTMTRVIEYMRHEVCNAITLEGLAGLTGYSPDYFLKCFKAETGQTPHRFLVTLRPDLAEDLLRSTTLSITEVASRAGFSSQAHLTSTMKKERGRTPGQFRRVGK